MGREAIEQLQQMVAANQEALAEADGTVRRGEHRPPDGGATPSRPGPDLMHRPFHSLSEAEADELRDQVRRLAALLRSRAALRQKRANSGTLDAKRTLRANLRYGGVPLDLHYRRRHLKPSWP